MKSIICLFLLIRGAVPSCTLNNNQELKDMVDLWISNPNSTNHPCGEVIGDWDVSNVESMDSVFLSKATFNADLTNWNTSKVTRLYKTFKGATAFNGDLSRWDTSSVLTMYQTFEEASSFNSDISGWNTSMVSTLQGTFNTANSFNSDISGWDTSRVITLQGTFARAYSFNGDLSRWDTSNVKDLGLKWTFLRASGFNGDLSDWNTLSVTSLYKTFNKATAFNGDLSDWNTSSVTSLYETFDEATSFEGKGLEKWHISSISNSALDVNTFGSTPSLSECTRRKIYDAWFPQNTTYFNDQYGDWKFYECTAPEEESSSNIGMIWLIGIAAGGSIVLIVAIYLIYRGCCKKKRDSIFYPTKSERSFRTSQDIKFQQQKLEEESSVNSNSIKTTAIGVCVSDGPSMTPANSLSSHETLFPV
jgi:surface protein